MIKIFILFLFITHVGASSRFNYHNITTTITNSLLHVIKPLPVINNIFSWQVPPIGFQRAYEIEIFVSHNTPAIWTSGQINSSISVNVKHESLNQLLIPGNIYYLRLSVWLYQIQNHFQSEFTLFFASMIKDNIKYPNSLFLDAQPIWHSDNAVEFAMIRTTFDLPAGVIKSAVLYITAELSPLCSPPCMPHGGTSASKLLGAYKVFINAEDDQSFLAVGMGPGRNVNGTQGVDIINVTHFLQSDQSNCIGIQSYHTNKWLKQSQPKVLAQLEVTYSEKTIYIRTNSDWHAMDATKCFNPTGQTREYNQPDIFLSEYMHPNDAAYDYYVAEFLGHYQQPHEYLNMSECPNGWTNANYNESSEKWSSVKIQSPFGLPLKEKRTLPLQILSIPIVRQKKINDGHYILDFGKEIQGGVTLSVRNGSVGKTVIVTLSEELMPTNDWDKASGVRDPMRTGNTFKDTWILRDGPQTMQQHEYMEFRYAEVYGWPELLHSEDATAWVIRYPMDGSNSFSKTTLTNFKSSSSVLDSVWNFTFYSIITTGLDLNTDSNTRQRDLCHIDAFITSLGQYSISDELQIQWQTAVDAFQYDSNIFPSSSDFKLVSVLMAHRLVLESGDLELVRQRYTELKNFTLSQFLDNNINLLNKPDNYQCDWGIPSCSLKDLIDWPTGSRDHYVMSTISTVINSYGVMAADAMIDISTWLGRSNDAKVYSLIAKKLREGMMKHLFISSNSSTPGYFVDGFNISHSAVHASIWPAAADVIPDTNHAKQVIQTLKKRGMACSCMGAHWMLQGLYKLAVWDGDAAELALEFITANTTHSWLNMMRQGATCSMEAWTPTEKPNLSWSHPWCSAPVNIIPRLLMGIEPIAPSWLHFRVSPQPASLISAQISLPTIRGIIKVEFKQILDTFMLNITVPGNSAAAICVPPSYISNTTLNIAQQLSVDGSKVASIQRGRMLCTVTEIGPGKHVIIRM